MGALRLLPEDGAFEGAAREVDGEVVEPNELAPLGRPEHPELTEERPGEEAAARADLEDPDVLLAKARRVGEQDPGDGARVVAERGLGLECDVAGNGCVVTGVDLALVEPVGHVPLESMSFVALTTWAVVKG